ncbi:MAG: RsmE family RNA methyltransferase [Phycisphaerales bacterium]
MSCPWFHVPVLPAVGDLVSLARDEAKPAIGVRRLGAGDRVTLFDGAGGRADAALTGDRDRDGGPVVRVESTARMPRPAPDNVVGLAPPKGDRWSTALDMLGQLGVGAVVPLETDHGVVDASAVNRPRAARILLESCKQRRGAWVPALGEAASAENFVRACAAEGRVVLVAEPGGAPLGGVRGARFAVAIGPEGGFSPRELDAMRSAGAQAVDLGEGILRVETAAVAAVAALRAVAAG